MKRRGRALGVLLATGLCACPSPTPTGDSAPGPRPDEPAAGLTAAPVVADGGRVAVGAGRARYHVWFPDGGALDGGVQHASALDSGAFDVWVIRAAPQRSDASPPVGDLVYPVVSTAEDATADERVDAVVAAVRARVQQRRVVARRSPAETWEHREGDCTEIADLSAAGIRALGVPARVAAGIAKERDAFAWHAWVEFWRDGAWHTVDPSWGQRPADASHLRLDVAETSAELRRLNAARGELRVRALPAHAGARPDDAVTR